MKWIFGVMGLLLITACVSDPYAEVRAKQDMCAWNCPHHLELEEMMNNGSSREYTAEEWNNLSQVKEHAACWEEHCRWIQ